MAEAKAAPPAPTEVDVPKTAEAIRVLLKRTHAGDEATVPVVRKMLQNPAYLRMFGGELAAEVVSSFTNAMAGKNVGFREAVLKKLELMRAELLGENPRPWSGSWSSAWRRVGSRCRTPSCATRRGRRR